MSHDTDPRPMVPGHPSTGDLMDRRSEPEPHGAQAPHGRSTLMDETPTPAPHGAHRPRHTLPPDVARMLSDARSRAGLSQREAAEACGVSRWMVRLLERGDRAPRRWRVPRIADGLQLTDTEAARLHEHAVLPST